MQQAVLNDGEYVYRRYMEYQDDRIIKMYIKRINEIVSLSTPCYDLSKEQLDIDKDSKKIISMYKEHLEEYIQKNYSDVITITK